LSCVGRSLCYTLITRPEEAYRVSTCVIKKPQYSSMWAVMPHGNICICTLYWRWAHVGLFSSHIPMGHHAHPLVCAHPTVETTALMDYSNVKAERG